MLSNKIYTLVRRLFQMTQEGKLEWQETSREGVFQLILDDFVVRVAEEPAEEPKQPPRYVLRICNAKGAVLEQVTDADIAERIHESDEFMKDLYQRARRVAMGVENALDRIIQRLDQDQPTDAF